MRYSSWHRMSTEVDMAAGGAIWEWRIRRASSDCTFCDVRVTGDGWSYVFDGVMFNLPAHEAAKLIGQPEWWGINRCCKMWDREADTLNRTAGFDQLEMALIERPEMAVFREVTIVFFRTLVGLAEILGSEQIERHVCLVARQAARAATSSGALQQILAAALVEHVTRPYADPVGRAGWRTAAVFESGSVVCFFGNKHGFHGHAFLGANLPVADYIQEIRLDIMLDLPDDIKAVLREAGRARYGDAVWESEWEKAVFAASVTA